MPTSGQVHAFIGVIVGLLVSLPAGWLLVAAFAPSWVERALLVARARRAASFLTGLVVLAGAITVIAVLGRVAVGPLGIITLTTAGLAVGLAMIGASALALGLGRRLAPEAAQAWRVHTLGAGVLVLTLLVPFFGWFVVLPVVVVHGLGAATLGLVAR